MEHTFKIEKELKITTENIVDCVLSCEAGGFDYWGELCSDEKDYEAARQRLAEREKADMKPCYEDVLAEILESGGKLTVYDREDDKDHELTLEKLLNFAVCDFRRRDLRLIKNGLAWWLARYFFCRLG